MGLQQETPGHQGSPHPAAGHPQYLAPTLDAFVLANVEPGSVILTDDYPSYVNLSRLGYTHDPKTVGLMAAHFVLPWVHRVFALLKRWGSASTTSFAESTSRPTSTNTASGSIAAIGAAPPLRKSWASHQQSRPCTVTRSPVADRGNYQRDKTKRLAHLDAQGAPQTGPVPPTHHPQL
jgi:ISXO2-like transposase domain